jgi:hypothetical protein
VSAGKNGTASKRNPRNIANRRRPSKEKNRIRETSWRPSNQIK